MQLHSNGSSKFTSGRSFSISSKISSLGGQIVTEVGDGIIEGHFTPKKRTGFSDF